MIKRFGSLYAGHVEFADGHCGFDTPAVNGRFLSDDELAAPLATSIELAHALEDLGFDTLWFAEHHFQREGYECLSNLLMLGVHIVQETERIRIGCAFNVPPMWHPLRLAEDYAMADHLTDGRIRFGVGRGYHSREVEVFGAPLLDQEANRERVRCWYWTCVGHQRARDRELCRNRGSSRSRRIRAQRNGPTC